MCGWTQAALFPSITYWEQIFFSYADDGRFEFLGK